MVSSATLARTRMALAVFKEESKGDPRFDGAVEALDELSSKLNLDSEGRADKADPAEKSEGEKSQSAGDAFDVAAQAAKDKFLDAVKARKEAAAAAAAESTN